LVVVSRINVTFEHDLRDTSIRLSYLGTARNGLITGVDLNEIHRVMYLLGRRSAMVFTPCDPIELEDCDYSATDLARQPLPGLGDFSELRQFRPQSL
jgi:hypothetical protein